MVVCGMLPKLLPWVFDFFYITSFYVEKKQGQQRPIVVMLLEIIQRIYVRNLKSLNKKKEKK